MLVAALGFQVARETRERLYRLKDFLVHVADQRVVADRTFRQAQPVGSTDVPAVTAAFAGFGDVLASPKHEAISYTMLPVALVIVFFAPNSASLMRSYRPLVMLGFAALFVVAVARMLAASHLPFLYFQF